ncbi:TolB family protein [Rubrolithibacter danxiaensis]|uniref:TolB family protein n=1 Tax=Rubrolithibacter danxiaensis TaxID=3390805 RepID=UPI003BF923D6
MPLALVKDFRSASSQQSIQIWEFADYTQLPEDITISPNSAMAAYTHMDHLYTIPLKQGSNPVQITTSSFKEADANWSPNGNYLVFVANIADNTDCGEIRVVPSQSAGPVPVPEDGFDNNPADPLQPTTNNGKVIHSCGSESINWYP